MKASGRPEQGDHSESIEFVPKRELDRAQQEIERLRKENERLKEEGERLRRELEAALRASKRQAAPHSRGKPKANPSGPVVRKVTSRRVAPSRRASMNRSRCHYQSVARIAAGEWSRKAPKRNIRKRSSAEL